MKLMNLSRVVFTLSFILLTTQFTYGQKRETKTNILIDKFGFVESIKGVLLNVSIEYSINPIEIENLLSDEEIRRIVAQTFNEFFTKKEIDILYNFVTSSVYDKIYNNPLLMEDKVSDVFKNIIDELDRIAKSSEQETIEEDD